ncbi:uncharacterized protein A4U43_C08F24960 [Asparagus officinalis]|nr:uncharacterized protein A4U43_C08F24960 [Asparagus officinalis]
MDATSQPAVDILPPQVVGEDDATILTQEADIIIVNERSTVRVEGVEINLAEVEEAEAPIEEREELEAQRETYERTLLTLTTREDELAIWKRGKDKWRRKVDMQERMIDGLKTSDNKKSSMISKPQENLSHFEHDLHERDNKVRYLSKEVEVERQERNDAFE